MQTANKSLFDALVDWPRWQRSLLGVVLCALATYYTSEVVFVFMGHPTSALYDFKGIAVLAGFLMVCGGLGLLFRRPVLVGAVFAAAGVVFLLQFALRSTGNPLGWLRQSLVYLTPLLNGFLLARWQAATRQAEGPAPEPSPR